MRQRIYIVFGILLLAGSAWAGVRGYRVWNLVSNPSFKVSGPSAHHK